MGRYRLKTDHALGHGHQPAGSIVDIAAEHPLPMMLASRDGGLTVHDVPSVEPLDDAARARIAALDK